MTVYVRWYGKLLEGELLEGEHLGMKQVRIPLDGHHPIALFAPGHVYESPEQVTEKSSTNCQKTAEISANTSKIEQKHPEIAKSDVLPADDRETIERYKREHWDQDRNHLRIDCLDEFYQLWRMIMKPTGFVEAEAPVFLPPNEPQQTIAVDLGDPSGDRYSLITLPLHKRITATQLSLFE